MRIAISATGNSLSDQVDPRFGRCAYFIIAQPDTMDFEAIANAGATAPGGAGIATAQMIVEQGVAAVVTGNCGLKAYQVLAAAGIQVFTGADGTVQQAIEDYQTGKLQSAAEATVPEHSGSGRGESAAGAGPGSDCLCPQCGTRVPHQPGNPCYNIICPQCGASMVRG
jgi:predicted Fe-Mo cluster-binding NifX family protein